VLTEAGRLLLLAHGRSTLHQVERAREELGRVHSALAGRMAVGLPTSLARRLTVPLTRAFRRQMPDATTASYTLRAIRSPALRTQIPMATSAQRHATLTQQATQKLIRDSLASLTTTAG